VWVESKWFALSWVVDMFMIKAREQGEKLVFGLVVGGM
jgi:hypothetical protein